MSKLSKTFNNTADFATRVVCGLAPLAVLSVFFGEVACGMSAAFAIASTGTLLAVAGGVTLGLATLPVAVLTLAVGDRISRQLAQF
ncbi:MAG TPA: hypothetical protein VG028_05510 [Terriglobia bacterium]|nr:hypothetical protein [Terriglobia bacterium]